jgi:glycosyltransferase involved in cell wall biosynthesis
MTMDGVKLGILQRVLTDYRVPFFDYLAGQFPAGIEIAAGEPRPEEQIVSGKPNVCGFHAVRNIHVMKGGMYLCQQVGVIEWLEQFQPDALIVEANPRYLATPQFVRWMRQHNRPVVGWGLGVPPGGTLRANIRLAFLKQFDALLTYSRAGKAQYGSAGIPEDSVFVAPNAAAFRPIGEAPVHRVSFEDSPAVVIFVGRLQARKRVDLLLQACAQLEPDIQPGLVIVGDGPEKAALQALAAQIYPKTEFTGDLRGSALDDRFRAADLFALPGTGGLALQQALSFALPAIAAEGDGTQMDLVRPDNGWLVKPGDLESLKTALRQALGNPLDLMIKGQESFRIVRDEVNMERMAGAFESAVRFALERGKS